MGYNIDRTPAPVAFSPEHPMSNPTNPAAPTYHAVSGGHLHVSWCAHRNQTQWSAGHRGKSINTHMVELDGMTLEAVVSRFGAICCSHCMPSAPATTKITQAQLEELNGTTARRAALAAKAAAKADAMNTPALVDITARFEAADAAGDYAAAAPLYAQMMKMRSDLGITA